MIATATTGRTLATVIEAVIKSLLPVSFFGSANELFLKKY